MWNGYEQRAYEYEHDSVGDIYFFGEKIDPCSEK